MTKLAHYNILIPGVNQCRYLHGNEQWTRELFPDKTIGGRGIVDSVGSRCIEYKSAEPLKNRFRQIQLVLTESAGSECESPKQTVDDITNTYPLYKRPSGETDLMQLDDATIGHGSYRPSRKYSV